MEITGNREGNIGTHHNHITVGKVQHLGNAINHGIAQGDNGIHSTDTDTVDGIL